MKSPFPIYCCSIALRDRPVAEAAQRIADAGFSGMELWYPHVEKMSDAELKAFRETCRALGLSLGVISPYFSFTRGRERWEESLRTAHRVLHAAKILGIPKVRTFIDCGGDGLSSAAATKDDWIAARNGLQALCDLAPETHFVVETHEDTLADTLPSTQRILDEVSRFNLRLNYQPTRDFLQRGYLDCLDTMLPAVSHLHWEQIADDGSSTYIEEPGAIDFATVLDFLRGKNYRGTASVEYCWTPVEDGRLASAAKFLRGLIKKTTSGSSRKLAPSP